ncbi:hypothetical protein TEQG_05792 [Trichophyton equinum CBS 127.97]|uniref:Uncharacterized protein n=1 Tax=Trichophyton equinum (strain ATCC MYA-4606 / CBS 127.97) TaxID=559882 RepID=F2PY30_TRIEC|nr:hypothetical protein TEQG_05792 [Trichophyton equinum CBS 127.97]
MYHEKKLPAPALYIQKGKVISLQDLDTAYPFWVEGFGQQFLAQALIPAVEPTSSSTVSETPVGQQLASRVTNLARPIRYFLRMLSIAPHNNIEGDYSEKTLSGGYILILKQR